MEQNTKPSLKNYSEYTFVKKVDSRILNFLEFFSTVSY